MSARATLRGVVGLAAVLLLTSARPGAGPLVLAPAGGAAPRPRLAWPERIALERAVAQDDPARRPKWDGGAPRLGSQVRFDRAGARLAVGDRDLTLGLSAIGRDDAMRELGDEAPPAIAGVEVRMTRAPGVVEWWRSLPSGLEQGVTIAERPAGDGALRLEMATDAGVRVEPASDDEVVLRDGAGRTLARYAHLVVLDAGGERVPARLAVAGERIRIEVDDARARYPLVVDPLLYIVEEATLVAAGGMAADFFGQSVALSADGSRAIVGAYADDTAGGIDAGSARVFVRTGTSWTEEATLVAAGGVAGDQLGTSVALSMDGSRAIVGAPLDDTAGGADAGSAHVFVRTGTAWAEEATLLASGGAANDQFGAAVTLTGDGSRAIVGAPLDDVAARADQGSARVFLRTGTAWAEEATLLATGGASGDQLGFSVALSTDGTRAILGAPFDTTSGGSQAGSARVSVRSGTTWTEEAVLLAFGGAVQDYFGISVAMSVDGSRALVGGDGDDTVAGVDAGSAHVFSRAGTSWAEEAALVASGGSPSDLFGRSVALSGDGGLAIVSSPLDDTAAGTDAGSARVYVRTGTAWAEDATLLASGASANDELGTSVASSADASRALVGAKRDDTTGGTDAGSARVYSMVPVAANGTPCGTGAECATGFCTDGVCCESACGGATLDCQACSAALTGVASGTCALLSTAAAPTVTCRASAGACDVAETCTSVATTCPPDAFAATTVVCRPAVGTCDSPERCTGASAACPADGAASTAGVTCRASLGACDPAEVCDGVSLTCPGDARLPAGAVCRSVADVCDVEERCDGVSVACPGDVVAPAGTSCGVAPVTSCDAPDFCTGLSAVCPDRFQPATTVCGPGVSDVCDAPDHCAGTSAACVAEYLSGVECRAASGACDIAEACAGTSPTCPPDTILSAGISCRASTDTTCDPEETCDGVARTCPADVTTCAPVPDAGGPDAGSSDGGRTGDAGAAVDGGSPRDAGVTPDAGPGADAGPPVAIGGCCHAAGARGTSPGAALVVLLALAARRRRRHGPGHHRMPGALQ